MRRDYYADLGLTPSAETEEIKRQFRKLALKYHPDRNPGKELEFISKFQAIQAANEILSDPQQRLKYDTDRLRAGYGKLYGPPKANTARKAPTNPYAPRILRNHLSLRRPAPSLSIIVHLLALNAMLATRERPRNRHGRRGQMKGKHVPMHIGGSRR